MNIPLCPACGADAPTVLRYRKGKTTQTATLQCRKCAHVFGHKEKTP